MCVLVFAVIFMHIKGKLNKENENTLVDGDENEKKQLTKKGKLKYVNGVKHASYGIGLGIIYLVQ